MLVDDWVLLVAVNPTVPRTLGEPDARSKLLAEPFLRFEVPHRRTETHFAIHPSPRFSHAASCQVEVWRLVIDAA